MADGGHLKYLKIAISLQMLKLSQQIWQDGVRAYFKPHWQMKRSWMAII